MNKVEALKKVKADKELLVAEERRLSIPAVMNIDMIRNLYDVFVMSLRRQNPKADPKDTTNRKKFLYAILYVCSPATLAGDVMRHKLRECVSSIIGCTPTGVSRDYKTALFFYDTYKEFHESVDLIIKDMLIVLNEKEEV